MLILTFSYVCLMAVCLIYFLSLMCIGPGGSDDSDSPSDSDDSEEEGRGAKKKPKKSASASGGGSGGLLASAGVFGGGSVAGKSGEVRRSLAVPYTNLLVLF
jgi:hypothetical protein